MNIKKLFVLTLLLMSLFSNCYAQNRPTDYQWIKLADDPLMSVSIALRTITVDAEKNPSISCINHRFVSVWEDYFIKGNGSEPPITLLSLEVYDLDCRTSKNVKTISFDQNYNVIKESDRGIGYTPIRPKSYGDIVLNTLIYYCQDYQTPNKAKNM